MRVSRFLATPLLAVLLSACGGGGDDGKVEQQLNDMAAKIMKHERLIAECMAGRGWEYIPTLPRGAILERESALAKTQGRQFDPASVQIPPDPNNAIVAKLSDADKNARADAYWGNLDKGGKDDGCYQLTYEQAWGKYPLPDPALLPALDAAFEADPRIVAARKKYASCMGGHGYEVTTTTDVYRIYQTREEELSAKIQAEGGDPDNSPVMAALKAESTVAYQKHEECVKDYRVVENKVRPEVLKKHGNR